jgi:hypothetical protein
MTQLNSGTHPDIHHCRPQNHGMRYRDACFNIRLENAHACISCCEALRFVVTYLGYFFAISRPTEVSLRLRPDSDYPHWPDLHTLTLIGAMYTKPTMLRNTMLARIASGSPIWKLLSRSILTTLKDDLDWLQARMEVEETMFT